MAVVGIDLGTTFSAIANLDAYGQPMIIPNDRGRPTTPSVVSFRDGEAVIGEDAKELQALGHPTAAYFKRQIGQRDWAFSDGSREYSAAQLSALLLAKLKRDAEVALGAPVRDAVVTVPAYFRNVEREATLAAGRESGLNVLKLVNEPTAAAVAYGARAEGSGRTLMVYDLGGGTFDVTLLRLESDEIRILTSNGDHELGGKDWDDRILQFLRRSFLDEFGADPMRERESLGDMLVRAEEAKRRLSLAQSATMSIVHDGYRGSYALTRERFEEMTADLMERTVSLARQAIEDAHLEPGRIDGVLLVGGSTRMPMVKAHVERAFGRPPLAGINVDEAVALGAAIMAAEAKTEGLPTAKKAPGGLAPRRRTVDVTNHSLGMIAINAAGTAFVNSIILHKNAEIPCVQSRPYQHRARRPSDLEVFITQGETDSPTHVGYLGKHTIHDVPPGSAGLAVVDIEYRYDASGTVQVSAKFGGKPLRVTVDVLPADIPDRFSLSPEQAVPQHVTAYLAFDLSGSMSGEPLQQAQRAAHGFLQNSDLAHCSIGIMGFSDDVAVKTKASQDARAVARAIDGLVVCETGIGNGAEPFSRILSLMGKSDGPRFGVVLTDGQWYDQNRAVARAGACKAAGIDIIAIGFGSADQRFLKTIASREEDGFLTSLDGLVEAFCGIARELTESGGVAAAQGSRKRANIIRA
jgi:molecular chaperone DnaK (HSP70)